MNPWNSNVLAVQRVEVSRPEWTVDDLDAYVSRARAAGATGSDAVGISVTPGGIASLAVEAHR